MHLLNNWGQKYTSEEGDQGSIGSKVTDNKYANKQLNIHLCDWTRCCHITVSKLSEYQQPKVAGKTSAYLQV